MDLLLRIEQLGFFTWMRESSSIWAFPTFLFLHTIGFAMLAGLSSGIDLRILGFARGMPLAPMKRLFPIMTYGFVISAITGVSLVLADATTKLVNPVFIVKMVFIALALINLRLIRKRIFNDPDLDRQPLPTNAKMLAATSLFLWLAVTTSGRLIAYIGPVAGLQR
jgi:hypothetical protein